MVCTRSDYKFVDGLDKIKVNGGIMPHRPDKDTMRGEDIAFCAEAVCEVSRALGIGSGVDCSMADTRLLGIRPMMIARALKAQADTAYLNSRIPTTTGRAATKRGVASSTSLAPMSWDFTGNLRSVFADIVDIPTIGSDETYFYPGEKCRREPIETLIEDTQKVRAGIAVGYPYSGSIERNNVTWSSDVQGEDPGGTSIDAYYYAFHHQNGVMAWRSGTHRDLANGGSWVEIVNNADIHFTYQTYLALRVMETRTPVDGDSATQQFIDVLPIASTMTSTRLIIDAATIATAAVEAARAHDIDEIPYAPPEQTSPWADQVISVTPIAAVMQRKRGDHTLY